MKRKGIFSIGGLLGCVFIESTEFGLCTFAISPREKIIEKILNIPYSDRFHGTAVGQNLVRTLV